MRSALVEPEDHDEVIKRVGARIRELREAARLTQIELAERVEMTLSNYQRVEHGLQNLTIETMVKVTNAIGAKIADLFQTPETTVRPKAGRPPKRVG